jgi:CheY-like chemotaxis protein
MAMKYKLLLMGTNLAAIDDFFLKMENYFELMTTTLRFNDIKNHVKYYRPDAIVYCMHKENRQSITNIVAIKQQTIGENIPFVIIGDPEECEICSKIAIHVVDFTMVKPLTAFVIRDQLLDFLDRVYIKNDSQDNVSKIVEAAKAEEAAKAAEAAQAAGGAQTAGSVPASGTAQAGAAAETPEAVTQADAAAAAEEEEEDEGAPYTYHPKKQKDVAEGEKLHVLVVDDDVRMIKTLKLFLEDEYQVATAVNGTIALRYLENKPADLILLDYEMPDLSGPEVLDLIRSHKGLTKIPVVFLTGASERSKIAKALALKPQGYLLKPVERAALMSKLHEILG